MNLSLLRDLEAKLHEAKQLSQVWDFFLTHFGEGPELIAPGQRGSDELLDTVLRQVGQQLFGRKVRIADATLTRLPEHGFIHGTVLLEGRLTSALYFENIHKGMLAILAGPGDPPETKFVRFTGRALYGALNRSEN